MAKIKKIVAREILDSRAHPTIEAIVQLDDNSVGIFSTPSGASVGKHEALELRDGDPKRYAGLGVLNALRNIGSILAPKLIGQDAQNQEKIDNDMIAADGTPNKQNLGANAILALSGAIARAQAASLRIPLYQYLAKLAGNSTNQFAIPTPMFNLINGGKHAPDGLDFQEFMIVPPKAYRYSDCLKMCTEIYYSLRETLKTHSAITLIGDEGGYAPILYANTDAFKILEESIVKAGFQVGLDAFLSLDAAATEVKHGNAYRIKDRPVPLPANDFIDFYIGLNEQFHLLSLEDPLEQNDWQAWISITQKLGGETLIIGDDLICTNMERLQKAISTKACNSVVIKPNQVGTITETIKVLNTAKAANFKVIVAHRSGETNDDFIADFAVACSADYAKFGAPARGERVAKYNRLLEIEHELS